jgi:hypothetical protein
VGSLEFGAGLGVGLPGELVGVLAVQLVGAGARDLLVGVQLNDDRGQVAEVEVRSGHFEAHLQLTRGRCRGFRPHSGRGRRRRRGDATATIRV